jgi:hypothetical protein
LGIVESPVAVFFTARGHLVFRVSSAKSNGIDADTLARLPLVDPAGLHPLELPGAEAAALDRRVRATDRLTVLGRSAQGAAHAIPPLCDVTGPCASCPIVALPNTGRRFLAVRPVR